MQENMVYAGDILIEIERAQLLEKEVDNEIKTLWAECGNLTFKTCLGSIGG